MPRLRRPALLALAVAAAGLAHQASPASAASIGGCAPNQAVCLYDLPSYQGAVERIPCSALVAPREVRLGALANRASSMINGCNYAVSLHAIRYERSQARPYPYNTTFSVGTKRHVPELVRVVGTDQAFERYSGLDNVGVGVFRSAAFAQVQRGFPVFG